MLNRIRELTGIYDLGFNPASVLGVVLPLAFVLVVGGVGALIVYLS